MFCLYWIWLLLDWRHFTAHFWAHFTFQNLEQPTLSKSVLILLTIVSLYFSVPESILCISYFYGQHIYLSISFHPSGSLNTSLFPYLRSWSMLEWVMINSNDLRAMIWYYNWNIWALALSILLTDCDIRKDT